MNEPLNVRRRVLEEQVRRLQEAARQGVSCVFYFLDADRVRDGSVPRFVTLQAYAHACAYLCIRMCMYAHCACMYVRD